MQGLLIAVGLCAATAGRTMITKPEPSVGLSTEALDTNVEQACQVEPVDVKSCVEARLARVEALKIAGDLTVALRELKACRDLDPAQFGPLAQTGPGRDLRLLGLVVGKIAEGDKQLTLAESSAKNGDRENSRVLFQQAVFTLDSVIRDIPKLRLGKSKAVRDLQATLQRKVR